ncbi:translation initiation factor eIF-2B subunit delta-like isoform X1 [Telopea speciosissima]|uniref:translation initiation factor eIF-2B subunit delta-like isoform X1 n=1 Tax=Telopea speciosissima TaxID=54955 RepID=UPI001CC4FA4B|nr:translation initiation factor eIF-2B subunit delta-like isoform X1 [Telopea speciosissima]
MEPRRTSRMVIDPKVRQVGFVTLGSATSTGGAPPPDRTKSGPAAPSSQAVSDISPSGNSLSPVMIPPPRHASDNLSSSLVLHNSSRAVPVQVPMSPLRRTSMGDDMPLGSYNPSESLLGTSPSPSSKLDDGDFFEEDASTGWIVGGNPGKLASSFPGGGFDSTATKSSNFLPASNLTTATVVKIPPDKSGGPLVEVQTEQVAKPSKEKTSKAERRALQEAQRAAKAAAKAEGNKTATTSGEPTAMNVKPSKAVKASQKKDVTTGTSSVAASEKKGGDRPPEKDRKKDVPPPRMQFDDKQRVEKAKRRAVVKQTEVRNRVQLFRHLPQYEHGTQLPDLESKFFLLDPMHPAIYKVGLQYLSGDISGGNARCIAMLQAFKEAIRDYSTPMEKSLNRDLTAKISSYVSFFIECRPLSISMGNAIRVLKNLIAKLPLTLSESEAKATLCADIDRFINEKIILADKVIVRHAVTKIRNGDVLLIYGSSCVVEMMLLYAHELGKQFRVVVIDSRPKLEGQALLRRLVAKGISCTYTHINAVSYIMHEVTRVFLGAASVLSNGTVYSRVGTACVAMVAHAFHVPVLVCCEAYKFHERVQLDSICFNELGDPDAIAKVHGRNDVNYLDNCTGHENLQLLNLMYDVTPSDYVSMIITDYGMVPTTSVPAIVREYRRECLWIEGPSMAHSIREE